MRCKECNSAEATIKGYCKECFGFVESEMIDMRKAGIEVSF